MCAIPARSQTPSAFNYFDYNRAWYADPLYRDMVHRAQAMPPAFSFINLRVFYMQSSFYRPVSDDLQAQLISAANTVAKTKDATEMYKALESARAILRDQAGNIAIAAIGENLSRRDKRFGDVKFYTWLRNGLMADVLSSGDGASPEGAYDVMTLEEETGLLRALKVKIVKSETVTEGGAIYNMYEIARARGPSVPLFVNATYPLSWEEKNAASKPKALDFLPR